MPHDVLEVEDLCGGYGSHDVIENVSFSVKAGQVALLVGANAAGKSTILRGIMGLLPQVSGTIRYQGQLISVHTHRLRSLGIAYVPQRRPVFNSMSIRRNLELACEHLAIAQRAHETARILEHFPALFSRLDQLAGTLSGGERQQLAISCALVSRPSLILADEPTVGVAPALRPVLLRTLGTIAREGRAAVVLIEHDVANAAAIADQVIGLRSGRVVVSCPVAEFSNKVKRRIFFE